MRLVVLTVTSQGTFVLTAWNMNVPTAVNAPQVTPNIIAPATTVLFATASVTPHASVRTTSVLSAMTWDTSSPIVPSQRTPVVGSSSTTETRRDCNLVLVVQVFDGGIVTVRGLDLIFSIVHLSPLSSDCPFTFTISIMFLPDVYQYTICIPHLSRSPLVTILPQPSMRFYGPCSSKDTINTASFCTMYFKLDLRSAVL